MKAQLIGRSGQSLIEILIGITLMSMAISYATLLIYGGQNVLIDRQNSVQARSLAEQGLDASRSIAGASWNNMATGTYGLTFASNKWSFSGGADYQNIFTRKITITDVAQNEKQVVSDVSWFFNLQARDVKLTTLITNWQNAIAPPNPNDTGGSPPSGNWQNPQTLGSINLGPGEQATGLRVVNKIVYLSAQASDQNKPDFFVVDATNGQSPFIVSSIDTGPGLLAIDVNGNYAYVAQNDNNSQFQVINISNISSPTLVKTVSLPGASQEALSVFYAYSKVYVGLKTNSGPELFVLDASNPANPTVLGSYNVGADVNGIYVYGNTAYLATSNDSKEVDILDVTNPASIKEIGSFNAAAGDDGQSVWLAGSTLYLGRTSGSNDFLIMDASTPAAPTQLSSNNLGGVSVNGIRVSGTLAFLATSDSNKEFQVWNISNPASPSLYSSFNFPQVATGIDYENNIVYVSVRSNDGLRIVTSQ